MPVATPQSATRPAPQYHAFVRRLTAALRGRCRLREGSRVLVAVSGGADSMALLHGVSLLSNRRGWGLTPIAAHVQHHLREDDEAEGDALLAARAAFALRVPFVRADLDPHARGGHENTEAWARRGRYRALVQLARSYRCDAILTAHHADDQLETLLMRLLRGAGLRGLGAIPWRSRVNGCVLLRPMLHHTRAEAEEFLRGLGVAWRFDQTNADATRMRARLRRDVTPTLEAIAPGAARRAALAADTLRRFGAMERAATDLASRVAVRRGSGEASLPREEARALPASLLGSLLREELTRAGVPTDRLTRGALAPLVRAIRDEKGGVRKFALARGVTVTLTRDAASWPAR